MLEEPTLTDPLTRQVGFIYDLAGRVTTQTLPDGRVITYAYDANGNVTSITPPSRPGHTFTYTPLDLEGSYDPPDVVGVSPDTTTYAYNLDRQLTTITRPDGTTISLDYDSSARLSTLTTVFFVSFALTLVLTFQFLAGPLMRREIQHELNR